MQVRLVRQVSRVHKVHKVLLACEEQEASPVCLANLVYRDCKDPVA